MIRKFSGTDAAAAGDHALGALQVGAVGLAGGEPDVAGVRGQGAASTLDGFDRRCRRWRASGHEAVRTVATTVWTGGALPR